MTKPIAVAVYMTYDSDMYSKELFTEEEIEKVRNGEDKDIKQWKTKIVKADLTVEDQT